MGLRLITKHLCAIFGRSISLGQRHGGGINILLGTGMSIIFLYIIVRWLSKYIFGGSPEDGPCSHLFELAVLLSLRRVLSLGQMFLGFLYLRMDMTVVDMWRAIGWYDIATHVPFLVLQFFIWERFRGYVGSPLESSIY